MLKPSLTESALWAAAPAVLALAVVAVPDVVAYLCAWLIVALLAALVVSQFLHSRSRED